MCVHVVVIVVTVIDGHLLIEYYAQFQFKLVMLFCDLSTSILIKQSVKC